MCLLHNLLMKKINKVKESMLYNIINMINMIDYNKTVIK